MLFATFEVLSMHFFSNVLERARHWRVETLKNFVDITKIE